MPTLRAVQKWRREDGDFEILIHDAWVRGCRCGSTAITTTNGGCWTATNYGKHIHAMAGITRDRSHQIIAAQTRLDRQYAVQSKRNTSGGPFVVGWQSTPSTSPTDNFL